jgi:hypothetical protein
MKYVYLTNSPLQAMVDDEDYDRVSKYAWWLAVNGRYVLSSWKINGRYLYLHQFVMNTTERWDHKDGNGLNNCKENLRPCTHSQNLHNVGPRKGKKYKGVYWSRQNKAWLVQITKDRKWIYGGSYSTEEAAARAYDRLAKKYHGEFAHLNFPEEGSIQ